MRLIGLTEQLKNAVVDLVKREIKTVGVQELLFAQRSCSQRLRNGTSLCDVIEQLCMKDAGCPQVRVRCFEDPMFDNFFNKAIDSIGLRTDIRVRHKSCSP